MFCWLLKISSLSVIVLCVLGAEMYLISTKQIDRLLCVGVYISNDVRIFQNQNQLFLPYEEKYLYLAD